MARTRKSLVLVVGLVHGALSGALLIPTAAYGQYTEATDAAPPAASVATPAPSSTPSAPSAPSASSSSSSEGRPVRGPSVRERTGRRSRAGSTASGVLFLVVLVGAMGWYVVKRLRR